MQELNRTSYNGEILIIFNALGWKCSFVGREKSYAKFK